MVNALKLDIIIVGGGIGGLATANALVRAGHKVTVLEAAIAKKEVGAGVLIAPNVSRVLIRWGLGSKMEELAGFDKNHAYAMYRYENGETLLMLSTGDKYEWPTYSFHRADLASMLYDLAAPHIAYRPESRVASIDPSESSVTLESGEKLKADVIIGADGIRSFVRDVVVGGPQQAKYTGDSAYRFIIPMEDVESVPELRPLIDRPTVSVWYGPQKHLVTYGIRGKKSLNVVALVEDGDESVEYSWTSESDTAGMRALLSGWEPRVEKLLALVKSPSVLKFKLMDCEPLETWIHPQGNVALVGDACHPMLPYRAQGAAMAIEDAECIGRLFSHVTHRYQIHSLLKAYEGIRYARATKIQQLSTDHREISHFPDGPKQLERDARMKARMKYAAAASKGETDDEFGSSKSQQQDDANYDITQVADEWWEKNGVSTLNQLTDT